MTLSEFRQAAIDCGAEEWDGEVMLFHCAYFSFEGDAVAFHQLMKEAMGSNHVLLDFRVGFSESLQLNYVQYG